MTYNKDMLLGDYYELWISIFKEGAVRNVTMKKYNLTLSWIRKLCPDLKCGDLNRLMYQKIINDYAREHEKQTVMDFHHQLKSAVLELMDEGILDRDPTRKVIIKGKEPRDKKQKYLNQYELHNLLNDLNLGETPNYDWLLYLIAKTGMRCSEALAITPSSFDFSRQIVKVVNTWNYKEGGGFTPTKNESSKRTIKLDWQTANKFAGLINGLPADKPIFVKEDAKVYNSTINDLLERHCKRCGIPVISVHGLRHTHASMLLFAGCSINSVAKRLGHSSTATTQKIYLHIITELDNQDTDIIMRSLATLT